MITAQQLANAYAIKRAKADLWVHPLNAAMAEFGIASPVQVAAFIAQVGHESGRLQFVRELWNTTQCPWQAKYEGRADLGNTKKGDGKKFMGRGLIQITGRSNYADCAAALGIDCVNHPELLELPINAAMSAAWFWSAHGCNAVAGNFRAVTRIINGGYNGLNDRIALLTSTNQAFA